VRGNFFTNALTCFANTYVRSSRSYGLPLGVSAIVYWKMFVIYHLLFGIYGCPPFDVLVIGN
jgi:hypothetical protein